MIPNTITEEAHEGKTAGDSLEEGYFWRHCDRACFDSDLDGVCADCGAATGLWTLWFGSSDLIVCAFYELEAVYRRRGCDACCHGGRHPGGARDRGAVDRSKGSGSRDDAARGDLVFYFIFFQGGADCPVYFDPRDGRVYLWRRRDDYHDADPEALWRRAGNGGSDCSSGECLGAEGKVSSVVICPGTWNGHHHFAV